MQMIKVTESMRDELPAECANDSQIEVRVFVGWEGRPNYHDGFPVLQSVYYMDLNGQEWQLDPDSLDSDDRALIETEYAEEARQDAYERYADYVYESARDAMLMD